MKDAMRAVMAMADDELVSRETVAEICLSCAEKMERKGLKAVRASLLKAALADGGKRVAVLAERVAAGKRTAEWNDKKAIEQLSGELSDLASEREALPNETIVDAVELCKRFVSMYGDRKVLYEMKWGFDTTHFGTPSKFRQVMSKVGIDAATEPSREGGAFIWKGSGISVWTGNNPMTGEYYMPNRRESEIGYASYIGIEGDAKKVMALAEMIRDTTDWKDESPNARDYI